MFHPIAWRSLNVMAMLFCIVSQLTTPAHGGIVEGSYRGSETWMYLDRFVFNPVKSGYDLKGKLEMRVDYPSNAASKPSVMLFYKGGDSSGVQKEFGYWERAYNQGLKCYEKAQIASMDGGMYLPLPGGRQVTTYTDDDGREWSSVTLETEMNTYRSRWMFISVGNCKSTCTSRYCANSLDIKYHLNLTNGQGPNMYFSADKIWYRETAIAFFALYLLLAIFAVRTIIILRKEQKFHYSVQLLMSSIFCSMLSLLLQTALYTQYSETGINQDGLEAAGVVFSLLAEFMLLLMVVLVAKGWTIVRHKISARGRVRLSAYMTIYIISSIGCWVYYVYFVDPADIVYVYETVPGAVFVGLRCVAFGWFTYAVAITLRTYKQKRAFYKKFWLFVGVWILTLPFLVIVNNLVDVWFRAKVVNLLSIFSTFLCQTVLCIMYHPHIWGLSKTFPFHATTHVILRNKTKRTGDTGKDGGKIEGSNTFEEAHLLRAFQLSSQMRHSVTLLQSYTNDLHTFLDDIRISFKSGEQGPIGEADLESGLSKPALPSVVVPRSQTNLPLEMALNNAVRAKPNMETNPVARAQSSSFRATTPQRAVTSSSSFRAESDRDVTARSDSASEAKSAENNEESNDNTVAEKTRRKSASSSSDSQSKRKHSLTKSNVLAQGESKEEQPISAKASSESDNVPLENLSSRSKGRSKGESSSGKKSSRKKRSSTSSSIDATVESRNELAGSEDQHTGTAENSTSGGRTRTKRRSSSSRSNNQSALAPMHAALDDDEEL